MADTQKEVLQGMATRQLSQREVNRLMDTIQVLSSAMSTMVGTYMTASDHWRANVVTGEIEYDLGLAAALDREAQIGVSGHEIAHLRFSDAVKYRRAAGGRDQKWAHYLTNVLEDRRVEILMVADFPGLADKIERLRRAFDAPLVERAMGMAEPHVQFLGAIYATAFDRQFVCTSPEAQKAIAEFKTEIEELVNARSTGVVARAVEREGGILERLIALRDLPSEEALKRDPEAVKQLPQPPPVQLEPTEGAGGDAGEGAAGDVDAEPIDGGGEAGAEGTAPDEQGAPGDGSGGGLDPDAGEEAGGDAGGGAGTGEWAPSQDDLASLPDGMGDMLRDVASSAEAMAELAKGQGQGGQELEHDRADAELLARSLSGMRDMVGAVRRQVTATRDLAEGGVDDARCQLTKNDGAYDKIESQVLAEANVLARRLRQVLTENRADRLASVQYRSGQRLSMPGLMHAVSDPNHDLVYRRKGRSRNRQYAISIVGDVSGSMHGDKMSQMAYTAILGAKAIEEAGGCEIAVYAFANDIAILKPPNLSLEIRGGYMGNFGKHTMLGGGTQMGKAITRVGSDMLARYDDSWRRVVMVVTDGQPSDGDAAEKAIRSLIRHDDFDFFGIGIQTQGRLAQMFPHWIALADAWELGPALMRMMRKAIVSG